MARIWEIECQLWWSLKVIGIINITLCHLLNSFDVFKICGILIKIMYDQKNECWKEKCRPYGFWELLVWFWIFFSFWYLYRLLDCPTATDQNYRYQLLCYRVRKLSSVKFSSCNNSTIFGYPTKKTSTLTSISKIVCTTLKW